jgi:hypothetical protein
VIYRCIIKLKKKVILETDLLWLFLILEINVNGQQETCVTTLSNMVWRNTYNWKKVTITTRIKILTAKIKHD